MIWGVTTDQTELDPDRVPSGLGHFYTDCATRERCFRLTVVYQRYEHGMEEALLLHL